VKFGLRSILLLVAVVLFIVSMLVEENSADLLALGLAAFAGALLVSDLGIGRGRGRL
jgi:hypothetical protein